MTHRPLRSVIVLATSAIATVTLIGCSAPAPSEEADRTLTVAVEPCCLLPTFDPASGGLIFGLPSTQAIYEPLVSRNVETFGYTPVLASEYSLSDDRRTLSITLRDDVDFTDGEHLTAEAVKTNLDWVMEKGTHYSVGEIKRLEPEFVVTGEYELEIRAASGIGDRLMTALTYLAIVSPLALDDPEALDGEPAPGTGPYIVDDIVPDVSVSYVRNPEYRDPGAYDFDTVEFVRFDDKVAGANALKSGQVDVAQLDISLLESAESSGLTTFTGAGRIWSLIWLDHAGSLQPALADKRVRQAIAYAFDRETINETLGLGYGIASSQPFAEGSPEYVEGGDDRYAYDIEKARELMEEAGYADGFEITIPVSADLQAYQPVVEQTLSEIGIHVTWEDFPEGATGAIVTLKYPLVLFPMNDSNWIAYFAEGGPWTGFGAVPADAKMTELIFEQDNGSEEDGAAAARDLGEYLLDEAWYVPIGRIPDVWGAQPGFDVDPGLLAGWPLQFSHITLAQ